MTIRWYFIVLMLFNSACYARTVSRYVQKKPGEVTHDRSDHFLMMEENPYYIIVDEEVLAQENFTRAKTRELEGIEPYNESRKTSITRTVYD